MAAAAAAAGPSSPALPLSMVDSSFVTSGRHVALQVVRLWPHQTDTTVDPPFSTVRLEAIDHPGAAVAGGRSLVSGAPIELYLSGRWAAIPLVAHDLLLLSRVPTLPSGSTSGDGMEHEWKLVLDDGPQCDQATMRVDAWKDRVLKREGKVYTLATLKEAETDAAVDHDMDPVDAEPTTAAAPASNKRARGANGAAIPGFQTAATLAAAETGGDGVKAKKKRLRGSDLHGAYTYYPLGEIKRRPRERLNLYGVVLFAKGPKTSRGSDLCTSITVADLSTGPNDTGMPFNIFRRSAGSLPREGEIQRGDIVRIHRAEVSEYQGNAIGVLPEKSSSFILISGRDGAPFEPYFAPAETYSEVDEEIVRALRRWWTTSQLAHRLNAPGSAHHPAAAGGAGGVGSLYSRTISQLEQRGFFDFVVRLIAVDPSGTQLGDQPKEPLYPSAVAFVWDGTELQRERIRLQRAILPANWELPSSSGGGGAPPPMRTPRYGSTIPMSFHPAAAYHFSPPHSGASAPIYLHLKNVPFECDKFGVFFLNFSSKSKCTPLGPNDPLVLRMLAAYAQVEAEKSQEERLQPYRTLQRQLTVPLDPLLPITSVKQLKSERDTPDRVGKFRVKGRVVGTIPDVHQAANGQAAAVRMDESKEGEGQPQPPHAQPPPVPFEQICKVECTQCHRWQDTSPSGVDVCQSCHRSSSLRYGYFLSLLFLDATGLVPILVAGQEADDLFRYPAANLYASQATRTAVVHRLAHLVRMGGFIDAHIHMYEVELDSPPEGEGGSASQDITVSQMGSQDLQAFFAPVFPGQEEEEGMEGDAHGRQAMVRSKRVFRLMGGAFVP